ncbi:hypothetical protein [Mariniflexile sp.]|uniref:hypothetical protein n=1 Tax=Mariniflexile sp. TaxID=1979402 RepID=UPI004048E632
MKFEDSQYVESVHYKIEMPFGNFYLLDKFFISELNEGVHFDWEMIKNIMEEVVDFYGENTKIGYISNRVNSYSMDPQNWIAVQNKYNMFVAGAIIYYNNMTFMNSSLEKKFASISVKRCLSLEEAIGWILGLKELN